MGNSEFHKILRDMEKIILTALLLASSQVAGHGKYRYYSSKSTGKYYSSNNRGYSSNNRGYSSSSGGYSSNNRGYSSDQARNGISLKTVEGTSVKINVYKNWKYGSTIKVNGKKVVKADVKASNGVIHFI